MIVIQGLSFIYIYIYIYINVHHYYLLLIDNLKCRNVSVHQVWWHSPVILAGSRFEASPGKKFVRLPSQSMAECGGTHLSSQLHGKHKYKNQWSRPTWEKSKTLSQKRAGNMVEVVECLPSKYEALSSNFSTIKQNKTKNPHKEMLVFSKSWN
jgi:hypothetical protein